MKEVDLHNLGYNIPYMLQYTCYKCNSENEEMITFSEAEAEAYRKDRSKLATVHCRKCGSELKFVGQDLLNQK